LEAIVQVHLNITAGIILLKQLVRQGIVHGTIQPTAVTKLAGIIMIKTPARTQMII
jgi:hypothetical protein